MKRTSLIAVTAGTAAVLGLAGTALAAEPSPSGPASAPASVPASGPASVPASGPASAPASGAASAPAAGAGSAVSEEQARAAAVQKAGGGQVTEVEAEKENGHDVWSVEVLAGDVEHEVDIDRTTGEIRDHESEKADNDTNDADDDADDDNDADDNDDANDD